jgi:hypothetical protein
MGWSLKKFWTNSYLVQKIEFQMPSLSLTLIFVQEKIWKNSAMAYVQTWNSDHNGLFYLSWIWYEPIHDVVAIVLEDQKYVTPQEHIHKAKYAKCLLFIAPISMSLLY